jgi:hypothetical protein
MQWSKRTNNNLQNTYTENQRSSNMNPIKNQVWTQVLQKGKIEISSNGQNCSILSQNVPKFELYKHNDELFNMYYRICYELWTFADFDRLCKLEKRGDEIKKKSSPLKLLSQSRPNFAEMILGWSPFKIVSVSAVFYPRWPPLLKI